MIVLSGQSQGLTPRAFPLPPTTEADVPGPSTGETFGAAFGLNNDVVNAIDWINRPTFRRDPGYNPSADPTFVGSKYQQLYSDNFVASNSAEETKSIMDRIDKEEAYRDTLSRAGVMGIAANMAAGTLSPTVLIPIGGWEYAGVRAGRALAIGIRAAEAAGIVGASVAGQEAVLQGTQETRTAAESAFAIGSATVLGGALGAAAAYLTRPAMEATANGLDRAIPASPEDVAVLMDRAAGQPVSAGAAAVDRGNSDLAGALGFEKSPVKHQDPLFRSLTSRSPNQQIIARDLAEIPGTIKANAEGIPTTIGGSVEYQSHAFDYRLAQSLESLDKAFADYRFGNPDARFTRLRSGFGGGLPGRMGYREFIDAVYEAAHTGDVSPIPQVQAAAQARRALIEDPLLKAAIDSHLFTEDVKPGDDVSHVYRLWDPDRVAAKRTELVGILARDFGERLDDVSRMVGEMAARGEKVDAGLANAARMTPDEIQSLAEDSVNTILGFSPDRGMLPRDIIAGPRGPLKERMLRIATGKVRDFVVRDLRHVDRLMTRTMATDIALMKKFGSTDLSEQLAKVNDDFTSMAAGAEQVARDKLGANATPEKITALAEKYRKQITKEQKAAHRDILAMVARQRGTYGIPLHPNGILHRAIRVVKQLNLLSKLGNITVSSISDVGKLVMNYGLNNAMRTAFHPLVKGLRAFNLSREEAMLANAALDLTTHDRQMKINDIMDNYGRGSSVERGVQYMSDRFGRLSLMDYWNTWMKQFAGVMAQTKIIEAVARRSAKDIEYLASNGIDREMGARIGGMFKKHGETDGALKWANTKDWTDAQAVEAIRAALHRDINRTIVTPGQDRPLWMSGELGGMVGQFHSFAVASVQRTMLTALQQRDMAALNGAMFMLGLGALQYYIKAQLSGRPLSDDPRVWAANAFDQSGLGGWIMDANNIVETATRGRVGVSAITGQRVSRYAALSRISALFGPSAGTVEDVLKTSSNLWAGMFPDPRHPERFNRGDLHSIRKMIPYNNIFYLRWLFDQAETGTGNAFGIPQRKQ